MKTIITDIKTFTLVNQEALDDLWLDQLEQSQDDILTFDELAEKVFLTQNRSAMMFVGIDWEH